MTTESERFFNRLHGRPADDPYKGGSAAKTHESSVSTTDKDKKALGRIFNLMNSRIITIREDIERTENRLANLRRMEKAALEEARAYRELYDRV